MSKFKKAKVVMLPTNEKAPIWLDNFGSGLYNCPINAAGVVYQHIYILSDEPIQIGDYVYCGREGFDLIAKQTVNPSGVNSDPMMKKVIATTDKSLDFNDYLESGQNRTWKILPQPSQSFIEKYVEYWNNSPTGSIITEVMVEFEDLSKTYTDINGERVKVNPKDNTITIKKAKENWTREEIIEDIEKAMIQGLSLGKYRDKWIS